MVATGLSERVTQADGERVTLTERVRLTETVGVARILDAAGVTERVMLTETVRVLLPE